MQNWGYGWFVGEINGHPSYNGGGQEAGLLNAILLIPDENLAIISVGNTPVIDVYYTLDVAADVMGMLLNQKAQSSLANEALNPKDLE